MEITTKSARETFNLGQKTGDYLIASGRGERILRLTGDLGSGKTTFIQGLAKSIGISGIIPSPTFIIVRQYKISRKNYSLFYHVDLYRLEKNVNIEGLGLTEIFSDPACLIAIEWAEKLKKKIAENQITISFSIQNENIRIINLNSVPLSNYLQSYVNKF